MSNNASAFARATSRRAQLARAAHPEPTASMAAVPASAGHSIARIAVLPAPSGRVQAALMVGSADNAFEREADAVASQVMGTPDSALSAPVAREAEEELQMKRDPAAFIAREDDEEELQMKRADAALQRSDARSGEDMMGSFEAGGDVEGGIAAKRGGGSGLSEGVRSFMEPRFGADFSAVRVHDDAQADGLSRSIGARAFATGSDVFFRAGEYQPDSSSGRALLAHELTHVVQQGGVPAQPKRARK